MINIIKHVTGTHVKPIHPVYLLNEDCSSKYDFDGIIVNNKGSNEWARVKTKSLTDRNNDCMWSHNDSTEGVYTGISISFAYGGSAAGFLYNIFIIISGLSAEELRTDNFVVVSIEGLSIDGHIYPRNKEFSYLCLIGLNVKQVHFFD